MRLWRTCPADGIANHMEKLHF